MCNPAYYPPYEKGCGHPEGMICTCTKYRKEPHASQHLGNPPENPEADVLRTQDADERTSPTDERSRDRRMDATDDWDGDGQYGAVESDSILTFDR